MQQTGPRNADRMGFSFLELQVAFVLLGISLAGLGPLVVMQSRQLRMFENRLHHQTTHYLVPSTNEWARRLGGAATIATEDPGPSPSPPLTLIDDGDPGYSERDLGVLDWASVAPPNAFDGDGRRQNGGGAGDTAIWEFTGLAPGWYEVLVAYEAAGDQATNAPYTVFDDTTVKGTVLVDQTVAPSGAIFEGVPWESLGLFSITGDTLRVELDDDADAYILADAVRLVPVRNELEVLSLDKSLSSEAVEVRVSVNVIVGG